MSKWSIHLEKDGQYTVRLALEDREALDAMPTSTKKECEAKGEASRGTQVGKPFSDQADAVHKLNTLEVKQRKDVKVAAAKTLLGVS